jgi:hypothetical protein
MDQTTLDYCPYLNRMDRVESSFYFFLPCTSLCSRMTTALPHPSNRARPKGGCGGLSAQPTTPLDIIAWGVHPEPRRLQNPSARRKLEHPWIRPAPPSSILQGEFQELMFFQFYNAFWGLFWFGLNPRSMVWWWLLSMWRGRMTWRMDQKLLPSKKISSS